MDDSKGGSLRDTLLLYENAIHDIKTPLNIIYSTIQLLELEEGLSCDIKKNIGVMKKNCFAMVKLLTNVSDSAKLKNNYLRPEYINLDVVSLIRSLTEEAAPYVAHSGLSLSFECAFEKKVMAVDKSFFDRILLNLISNSVKFTEKGGKIKIKLTRHKGYVKILLTDNGCGISEEKLAEIFDRYAASDYTTGSGIGLNIVKELTRLLDGTVMVSSEPGKGTKVTLKLPVFTVADKVKTDNIDDFYINNMARIELTGGLAY